MLGLGQEFQMRPELQAVLSLERVILAMTSDELIEFITKDTSEGGQRKTLSILHFVISGKIKKLKRGITWKDARSVAWRLIRSDSPNPLSRKVA
jgi:hypothetical protein